MFFKKLIIWFSVLSDYVHLLGCHKGLVQNHARINLRPPQEVVNNVEKQAGIVLWLCINPYMRPLFLTYYCSVLINNQAYVSGKNNRRMEEKAV